MALLLEKLHKSQTLCIECNAILKLVLESAIKKAMYFDRKKGGHVGHFQVVCEQF